MNITKNPCAQQQNRWRQNGRRPNMHEFDLFKLLCCLKSFFFLCSFLICLTGGDEKIIFVPLSLIVLSFKNERATTRVVPLFLLLPRFSVSF